MLVHGNRYDLVDDPGTDTIISWGPHGASFVVHKVRSSSALLPFSICATLITTIPCYNHLYAAPRVCSGAAPSALQAQQLLLLCAPAEHLCEYAQLRGCCVCRRVLVRSATATELCNHPGQRLHHPSAGFQEGGPRPLGICKRALPTWP